MVRPAGTYVPANIARLCHHDRQARQPRQGISYCRAKQTSYTYIFLNGQNGFISVKVNDTIMKEKQQDHLYEDKPTDIFDGINDQPLATQVPFAVHGYGALVALSILDRMHRPDMTVDEAVALLRLCIQEVQKRLVINLDRYMVRIVTKDGIEELPDLTDFAVKE
ncbi:unnamed protein product [Schistosoma margrebowiei]|uniref:Uncharacterized protein n=1 Tax=Schistosoma margrebowiei TaxID=48269 RepID=A0A183MA02_9TREM|nr:unnamed protein product [Schistosoma margrebowiei]